MTRFTRRAIVAAAGAAGLAVAVAGIGPVMASQRPAISGKAGGPVRLTPLAVPRTSARVPAILKGRAGTWQCYAQDGFRALANLLWLNPELGYAGADYGMLRATGGSIGGPLQQFTLCHNSLGYWVFFNDDNNDLVWAQINRATTDQRYGMLTASTTEPSTAWQKFNIFCAKPDGNMVFQSQANNDYVSTEIGYSGGLYAMLRARATAIGPWEQYISTEILC